MKRRWAGPILIVSILVFILTLSWWSPAQAGVSPSGPNQLPTVNIPTVTGTPTGPMAVVVPGNEPQINVRSGPGSLYDRVGVLLMGQKVPAKGRSPKGEWILIEYPGVPGGQAWVSSIYVEIVPKNVELPVVEPPPTPTPVQTATIDPTLAAKFEITNVPTRLPTFTPPPPLQIPTFTVANQTPVAGLPMGFIILGLASLGIFFGIVAFVQDR
jgi:hypothetical protein